MIQTTGLFEWWPKLINRSDLVLGSESITPTAPNMSGNILVIFVFLGSGLSAAIFCIILEACIFKLNILQKCKKFIAILQHTLSKCASVRKISPKNKVVVWVKSVYMCHKKYIESTRKCIGTSVETIIMYITDTLLNFIRYVANLKKLNHSIM